jgi:hypothetical protein
MNIYEAAQKYNPEKYARACCDTMMRKFEAQKLPPEGRFHYHQGVFLSGMYRTYVLTGDEKYYNYIKAWVDSTIDEKGNIKLYDKGQMDDIEPGVLLYPIYERTGDMRYKKALDTLILDMESYPRNEDGGYWHKAWCEGEMWLDGLYMGGPITAHYGSAFEKPEWFDMVAKQVKLMKEHTQDKTTGLWRHAWDINKKAAIITTGTAMASGATFITAATDNAPNPTCDNPSPIIENLLRTRLTPSSAQHNATSPPAIIARTIKSYENKSFNVSNIAFPFLHFIQRILLFIIVVPILNCFTIIFIIFIVKS